jgi:glycerol-3-phosphate acyltransferase PlsY
MMVAYGMILVAFICGALPFSVWIPRIFLGKDVRQYGDGNPGAANVFRTGKNFLGLIALLLDVSKAAAPVGFAYHNLQIRGIPMFFIAVAPVLGHMFSPFLAFKGGKAIATVLGVWIGLTLWVASLPAVIAAAIGSVIFTSSVWSVMLAMIIILITLLLGNPTALFLSIWAAVTLLLTWTHRVELRQTPHLRSWLKKFLTRSNS